MRAKNDRLSLGAENFGVERIEESGGHGIRTRNSLRSTSFPMTLLASSLTLRVLERTPAVAFGSWKCNGLALFGEGWFGNFGGLGGGALALVVGGFLFFETVFFGDFFPGGGRFFEGGFWVFFLVQYGVNGLVEYGEVFVSTGEAGEHKPGLGGLEFSKGGFVGGGGFVVELGVDPVGRRGEVRGAEDSRVGGLSGDGLVPVRAGEQGDAVERFAGTSCF